MNDTKQTGLSNFPHFYNLWKLNPALFPYLFFGNKTREQSLKRSTAQESETIALVTNKTLRQDRDAVKWFRDAFQKIDQANAEAHAHLSERHKALYRLYYLYLIIELFLAEKEDHEKEVDAYYSEKKEKEASEKKEKEVLLQSTLHIFSQASLLRLLGIEDEELRRMLLHCDLPLLRAIHIRLSEILHPVRDPHAQPSEEEMRAFFHGFSLFSSPMFHPRTLPVAPAPVADARPAPVNRP